MAYVGKQILDIITCGMYSDPLMILREYVQNATDSIDEAITQRTLKLSQSRINITLNGRNRLIQIEDNGKGLSNKEVRTVLKSIGHSTKNRDSSRGFRGIGRLGGLGYCDSVIFETRSRQSEKVAVVEWDANKIVHFVNDGLGKDVKDVLPKVASASLRKAQANEPPHFFRVTLNGVHRFHKDELMDARRVRLYLEQVAPVGYNQSTFKFAHEVNAFLKDVDGFRQYLLFLNDKPVLRPYNTKFEATRGKFDNIKEIVTFEVPGSGAKPICKGWYANTSFHASLPPRENMRGIRTRQGNIEIGDEYFLASSYAERRFSTWHIGELHFNYAVKPNARRDGFEKSHDYEKALEFMNLLGRHLSRLCRQASEKRSSKVTVEKKLKDIETYLDFPVFVDKEHLGRSLSRLNRTMKALQEFSNNGVDSRTKSRITDVEKRLHSFEESALLLIDSIDGRAVSHMDQKQLVAVLCKSIVASNKFSKDNLHVLMLEIVEPYLKDYSRKRIKKLG